VIYPVRYYGDPVLRKVATPITEFGDDLKALASDMMETMYEYNGVGLAAPQIGIAKRLFVALELGPVESDEADDEPEPEDLTAEEKRQRWGVIKEHVMVNPEILERDGIQYGQDGCLSLPGLYVERMQRDRSVTVRYQDTDGHVHTLHAEGHFAHVIQHEYDHLEGVLFFDRLPDAERQAFMEAHRQAFAEFQREARALLKRLKNEASPPKVR
jgi:peptide deformylase